ncbi:MAG: hypothetical protein V1897_07095 [Pseudomonadota bacterium]
MDWAGPLSRFNNIVSDPNRWTARVRIGFWLFGALAGGILAYTTRHYVNGDATAYLDMAEAFREGLWNEATLLGYSPGYSILLALFEYIVPATTLNELFVVKFLNFILFLAAMGACDFFVHRLTDEIQIDGERGPLPPYVVKAIVFSVFLVTSLIWVRVQIIAPDMLVFIFVLLSLTVLLNINRSPASFVGFAFLGLTAGLGYICKTFFFPFSLLLFSLAGLHCSSLRKAFPRILLSVVVMLIVSSPVIISQSLKAGRLSIGEVGSYNYAYYVAGEGKPVHLPKLLHSNPGVLFYDQGILSTFPHGDPAYWALGIKPVLNLRAQFNAIVRNLVDLMTQIWLPTLVMLVWFFYQFRNATFSIPRIRPPSVFLTLMVICLAGTGIYCLVSMEIRYVAAFLFLGFTTLVIAPEYKISDFTKLNAFMIQAILLVVFMVAMVIAFVVDQTHRALYYSSGKISHRVAFTEMLAVKDFLNDNHVVRLDKIAVFYPVNNKIYWAKMAGVRAVGEITDVEGFLQSSAINRNEALDALKRSGFKAVVVKQPQFTNLVSEGWSKVPGTSDYFVRFLAKN